MGTANAVDPSINRAVPRGAPPRPMRRPDAGWAGRTLMLAGFAGGTPKRCSLIWPISQSMRS